MRFMLVLFLMLVPVCASAAGYVVDYTASSIEFSGTHAGRVFEGVFEDWSADIDFDVDDLSASSVQVVIDADSAKTGNAMYDGTLPTQDWFSVKQYPDILFNSTAFTAMGDDTYEVTGDLMVKDVTTPFTFQFTLRPMDGPVQANAEMVIDRLDFNLGRGSDPDAQWVGREIKVSLHVEATLVP